MTFLTELQARQAALQHTLEALVRLESPTPDKAAVDAVAAWIENFLASSGASLERLPQPHSGDHLLARWGQDQPGGEILLLCHMDTVHPIGSLQANPCRVEQGRLYGPGVLDMKAGIAILLITLQALQARAEMPARPITALFTSDEETGSETSRPWIEQNARRAALVLCLEPALPDGSLKTWRKGVGDYRVQVRGRAAHAGVDPQNGVSAIQEIAHQILKIQSWTDFERGTTLNVGLIQGGTASNVVPAQAEMVVDLRVLQPGEAERIEQALRTLQPVLSGTTIEVQGELNRPPMPRDERMRATFAKAQHLAAEIGLTLTESGTGGGSDANFVAPLGIPVLDGLGGIGAGQHSEREFVSLPSLLERAHLLGTLLTHW